MADAEQRVPCISASPVSMKADDEMVPLNLEKTVARPKLKQQPCESNLREIHDSAETFPSTVTAQGKHEGNDFVFDPVQVKNIEWPKFGMLEAQERTQNGCQSNSNCGKLEEDELKRETLVKEFLDSITKDVASIIEQISVNNEEKRVASLELENECREIEVANQRKMKKKVHFSSPIISGVFVDEEEIHYWSQDTIPIGDSQEDFFSVEEEDLTSSKPKTNSWYHFVHGIESVNHSKPKFDEKQEEKENQMMHKEVKANDSKAKDVDKSLAEVDKRNRMFEVPIYDDNNEKCPKNIVEKNENCGSSSNSQQQPSKEVSKELSSLIDESPSRSHDDDWYMSKVQKRFRDRNDVLDQPIRCWCKNNCRSVHESCSNQEENQFLLPEDQIVPDTKEKSTSCLQILKSEILKECELPEPDLQNNDKVEECLFEGISFSPIDVNESDDTSIELKMDVQELLSSQESIDSLTPTACTASNEFAEACNSFLGDVDETSCSVLERHAMDDVIRNPMVVGCPKEENSTSPGAIKDKDATISYSEPFISTTYSHATRDNAGSESCSPSERHAMGDNAQILKVASSPNEEISTSPGAIADEDATNSESKPIVSDSSYCDATQDNVDAEACRPSKIDDTNDPSKIDDTKDFSKIDDTKDPSKRDDTTNISSSAVIDNCRNDNTSSEQPVCKVETPLANTEISGSGSKVSNSETADFVVAGASGTSYVVGNTDMIEKSNKNIDAPDKGIDASHKNMDTPLNNDNSVVVARNQVIIDNSGDSDTASDSAVSVASKLHQRPDIVNKDKADTLGDEIMEQVDGQLHEKIVSRRDEADENVTEPWKNTEYGRDDVKTVQKPAVAYNEPISLNKAATESPQSNLVFSKSEIQIEEQSSLLQGQMEDDSKRIPERINDIETPRSEPKEKNEPASGIKDIKDIPKKNLVSDFQESPITPNPPFARCEMASEDKETSLQEKASDGSKRIDDALDDYIPPNTKPKEEIMQDSLWIIKDSEVTSEPNLVSNALDDKPVTPETTFEIHQININSGLQEKASDGSKKVDDAVDDYIPPNTKPKEEIMQGSLCIIKDKKDTSEPNLGSNVYANTPATHESTFAISQHSLALQTDQIDSKPDLDTQWKTRLPPKPSFVDKAKMNPVNEQEQSVPKLNLQEVFQFSEDTENRQSQQPDSFPTAIYYTPEDDLIADSEGFENSLFKSDFAHSFAFGNVKENGMDANDGYDCEVPASVHSENAVESNIGDCKDLTEKAIDDANLIHAKSSLSETGGEVTNASIGNLFVLGNGKVESISSEYNSDSKVPTSVYDAGSNQVKSKVSDTDVHVENKACGLFQEHAFQRVIQAKGEIGFRDDFQDKTLQNDIKNEGEVKNAKNNNFQEKASSYYLENFQQQILKKAIKNEEKFEVSDLGDFQKQSLHEAEKIGKEVKNANVDYLKFQPLKNTEEIDIETGIKTRGDFQEKNMQRRIPDDDDVGDGLVGSIGEEGSRSCTAAEIRSPLDLMMLFDGQPVNKKSRMERSEDRLQSHAALQPKSEPGHHMLEEDQIVESRFGLSCEDTESEFFNDGLLNNHRKTDKTPTPEQKTLSLPDVHETPNKLKNKKEEDADSKHSVNSAVFAWSARRKLFTEKHEIYAGVVDEVSSESRKANDQRVVPALESPSAKTSCCTSATKERNVRRGLRVGLSRRRNLNSLHPYWSAERIRVDKQVVPDLELSESSEEFQYLPGSIPQAFVSK